MFVENQKEFLQFPARAVKCGTDIAGRNAILFCDLFHPGHIPAAGEKNLSLRIVKPFHKSSQRRTEFFQPYLFFRIRIVRNSLCKLFKNQRRLPAPAAQCVSLPKPAQ